MLRRRIKRDVVLTRGGKEGQQQVLSLGWDEVQEDAQLWEYTVLVTDVDYELGAIGQLYRDRCDCVDLGFCQNGFDELKNQWVRRAAEQLPKVDRWRVLLGYICERITRQTVLPSPPPTLAGGG